MTIREKIIVVALLTAAISVGVYEARRASQLQRQQALLIEQIQQSQQERDEAKRQLAALHDENEHADSKTAELLKLRGDVGVLRRQLSEAKTASIQALAPLAQASLPADLLEQQKRMASIKGLDGLNYSRHLMLFARDNQGWLPTNWQHVARFTNDYPVTGTNEFELVYSRPVNLAGIGTNGGKTILVREFLAWPTVNGQWGKIYGFADGHSEVIIRPDGDFATWEQQNTLNPESISR